MKRERVRLLCIQCVREREFKRGTGAWCIYICIFYAHAEQQNALSSFEFVWCSARGEMFACYYCGWARCGFVQCKRAWLLKVKIWAGYAFVYFGNATKLFPEGPKTCKNNSLLFALGRWKASLWIQIRISSSLCVCFCPSVCQTVLIFPKHSPGDLVCLCQVCPGLSLYFSKLCIKSAYYSIYITLRAPQIIKDFRVLEHIGTKIIGYSANKVLYYSKKYSLNKLFLMKHFEHLVHH